MSAPDQAFTKAYAKDESAPVTESPRAGLGVRSTRTHTSVVQGTEQIENLYAAGALYRLEVPRTPEVPSPHYAPPATQQRTIQRRGVGRFRTPFEATVDTVAPTANATQPAPKPPSTHGLEAVARRLSHFIPPAPQLDLPPEVLVVEEPQEQISASPSAPNLTNVLERMRAISSAPPTDSAAASSEPVEVTDDVATMVEVCTPWEGIHEGVIGSLVLLPDATEIPAVSAQVVCDLAMPPFEDAGAQHESPTADPLLPPLPTVEPAIAEPIAIAPRAAPEQKIHRLDPPQTQSVTPPHFVQPGKRKSPTEAEPQSTTAASEPLPALPVAELTPEETATLLGDSSAEATPVAPVVPTQPADATPTLAAEPLAPMWEVDRLQWPTICERLMKDEQSYFAQAGGKLVAAAKDGLKTLGITGSRRGEGRTTLALCLARCASQAGLSVALIDADFTRPQLAAIVGLEVAYGWQDAAQGKIPLAESAVRSLADKITVLPLEASSVAWPMSLADKRVAALIRSVSQSHDLVIVDLGPLSGGGEPIFAVDEAAPLDAVIVLRDLRYATPSETQAIGQRLYESGIEAIGVAENFVAAEKPRS